MVVVKDITADGVSANTPLFGVQAVYPAYGPSLPLYVHLVAGW
jgi:hypothetical protein